MLARSLEPLPDESLPGYMLRLPTDRNACPAAPSS